MKLLEYTFYRLIYMIVQIFGAVALIFGLIELLPYDPSIFFRFNSLFGDNADAATAQYRASLGLDLPLYQRYINFFSNIFLHGSLGNSWMTGQDIAELYARSLQYSILTFGIAFLIYTPLSLYFAIMSVKYKDRTLDYILRVFTTLVYSIPPIIIGVAFIWIDLQNQWNLIPLPNTIPDSVFDVFKSLTIPIVITIFIYMGWQFRIVRTQFISIMSKNYIRTARAKGLPERLVIYKHALKNVLPLFLTTVATTFPITFTGIAALEIVFNIPGGGWLMTRAALDFDWPILIAGTAIYTTINAFVMAITDLVIFFVTPQDRYRAFYGDN